MKKTGKLLSWVLLTFLVMGAASAADNNTNPPRGTKADAVALVKKAVQFFNDNGADKAFAAFSVKGGAFTDRDLYILAYDTTGTCLAHGQIPALVGMNRINEQDADGKFYIKDKMDLMKNNASFWQEYKFADPLTHKILPKATYCEVVHDAVLKDVALCSGVYIVPAQ
ncbi:MAG: cache domain-containing protein [Alphaproteobacteria bacterium]